MQPSSHQPKWSFLHQLCRHRRRSSLAPSVKNLYKRSSSLIIALLLPDPLPMPACFWILSVIVNWIDWFHMVGSVRQSSRHSSRGENCLGNIRWGFQQKHSTLAVEHPSNRLIYSWLLWIFLLKCWYLWIRAYFCIFPPLFTDYTFRHNVIEDVNFPVIGSIDGVFPGGNLEFVMCWAARFFTLTSSFSLPELNIVLISTLGDIQRHLRVVKFWKAAEMIPTRKRSDTQDVLKLSSVDQIVSAISLVVEAAVSYALKPKVLAKMQRKDSLLHR